jgi:NAD(P)-dependent dehydrogenase (short-subunit alcohol dehydrogenase family)
MSTVELSGKTALITGANQGIGWAIAKAYADAGARVIVNYPDDSRYPHNLAELGEDAIAIKADVGNVAAIRSMFAELDAQGFTLDILVNNAGIYPRAEVLDLDEATWDVVHDVNQKGTFFCTQEAARRMVPRGSGKVINIASVSAIVPTANGAHYCATKAGVVALTKSIALALAPKGITVNAIGPGLTDTAQPRYGFTEEEMAVYETTRIPMGRMGQPEDIARGALYLASDLADFVTGQTLFINGGELMVP